MAWVTSMGRDNNEREFDDEVYEDDYYEENFDEEEIDEDSGLYFSEKPERRAEGAEEEETEETVEKKKVYLSFACDDCDYRWDDVIVKNLGNLEDEEDADDDVICPMCGSMNVTQI